MKTVIVGFLLFISAICLEPLFDEELFAAGSISVTTSTATSGNKFTLTISGNNIAMVNAVEIKLLYNSRVLSNPQVANGAIIDKGISQPGTKFGVALPNVSNPGVIAFAATSVPSAFSGSGPLITVTFDITGQSPDSISSVQTKMFNASDVIFSDLKIFSDVLSAKGRQSGLAATASRDLSLSVSDAPAQLGRAMKGVSVPFDDISFMRISEDPFFAGAAWVPYATAGSFTLKDDRYGKRTLYIQFRDSAGNVFSTVYNGSVFFDNMGPAGTLRLNSGDRYTAKADVTATLAFTDDSGVSRMQFSTDNRATWTPSEPYASIKRLTLPADLPAGGGLRTVWVRVTDGLGNRSERSADIAFEPKGPKNGRVIINKDTKNPAGARYTSSTTVGLTLSADDVAGVAGYCISSSDRCPSRSWTVLKTPRKSFVTATPVPWRLPAVNSYHTVNVWFRDIHGNVTQSPAFETILLDTVAPVNGRLTATQRPGALQLDWSGFTDQVSKIKEFRLYHSTTSVPAACSGELLYTGSGSSYLHASLNPGTMHYYRVCATDNALNTGTGAIASARAVPELQAPSGKLFINRDSSHPNGATYTRSRTVALTLDAADASGVAAYCVSNGSTCKTWTPARIYPLTVAWTLTPVNGEKRVNVWFRDVYGNVTPTAVSSAVTLDMIPPTGSLKVTPVSGNRLKLDWSGISDALSRIDPGSHVLRHSTAAVPPSCSAGDSLTPPAGSNFTHAGLKPNSMHYYRFCVKDRAGNLYSTTASGRTLSK